MIKKVIIYGIGSLCKRLFETMPKLIDYVDFFIDTYNMQEEFMGKKVERPYILKKQIEIETQIVITATNNFYEIYGMLRKEYGLSDEQILYSREWLYQLLTKTDIIIQPISIRLEACTYCQLNCRDCYMRKKNFGGVKEGYLSLKNFKKFLAQNSFVKTIELSNNGEAFLNPELVDILEYAFQNNIDITFSNGVNFNYAPDRLLDALVKYSVKHITLSIDGGSQEIYSYYRRNGNFDTIISHIKKLNKYKESYQSQYPKVTWQYILMEHNESDVEIAKQQALDMGIEISYKLDWNREFQPVYPEKLSKITGLELFNRKEWKKKYGLAYNRETCCQMIFQPQINWDGRLFGCCGNFQEDWKVNVFEKGLIECLNKGVYKKALLCFLNGERNEDLENICLQCNGNLYNSDKKRYLWL